MAVTWGLGLHFGIGIREPELGLGTWNEESILGIRINFDVEYDICTIHAKFIYVLLGLIASHMVTELMKNETNQFRFYFRLL